MKKIALFLSLIILLASCQQITTQKKTTRQLALSEDHPVNMQQPKQDGAQLFKQFCGACHSLQGGMAAMSEMKAPPMPMLVHRYKMAYPNKKDFIQAIVSWATKPSVEKSIMPGAVRRFKLMPPMPAGKENLIKIAGYLYDTSSTMHHWKNKGRGMMNKCGKCGSGM